jgi:hypothetical protein
MFSLYRMLFRNEYWRILLRKATWREAGMSLRRAHKDNRARKHLLGVFLLALLPLICLAYFAWVVGSGAIFFVPFVIPVLIWRAYREKKEAIPHIAPQSAPIDRRLSEEVQQRMRTYLAELTLFYAVMIGRAGSESFLKQKVLPEGVEVATRRNQLDILRTYKLWERMARIDRESLMMPDGHWEWSYIYEVGPALESLRLLRWILRIDFYLPTIGQQLRADYGIARDLLDEPKKIFEGKELVELADIRIAREASYSYLSRCIAEGISRGYFPADSEDVAQWAGQVSEQFKGKQHDDLVLGDKLVSEVSENELRWAMSLAQRRTIFLEWVMGILDRGVVPDWEMSVFPKPNETAQEETSTPMPTIEQELKTEVQTGP